MSTDQPSGSEFVGLQFPCSFPIKVMGLTEGNFESIALGIIHKHYPHLTETSIQPRFSKDRKYLALTVTIEATSQEQLDNLYRELSSEPLILIAL